MSRTVRLGDQVNLVLPSGYTTQATITVLGGQDDIDVEYHHHAASGDLVTTIASAVRATTWPASGVNAQGTLTMDVQPINGDTYTIDGKTYTFETTLTDVDGNVNIGGSLAQARLNLVAAMDLSGVAGTDYATSMTAHTSVDIAAFIVADAILTAKLGGAAGSLLATTESFDAVTNIFDATTLGATTEGVAEFFIYG